jgi:hypothetical protein
VVGPVRRLRGAHGQAQVIEGGSVHAC